MWAGAVSAPYSAPRDSECAGFSTFSPGVRVLYRPLSIPQIHGALRKGESICID